MSSARYKWVTFSPQQGIVDALSRELGVSEGVAAALCERGICDVEEARTFLSPKLRQLSDPFDLPGMDAAVDCIWTDIDAGKKITIFGDYDVDGLTSTALLVQVLRKLGAECSCFLPDRAEEGYGLSTAAVERCLAEHRCDSLVTVDCGSCAGEQIEWLCNRGIDVVVTDHHEFPDGRSPARAFVNPKRSRDSRTQYLAGVGVAFKLCHAMQKKAIEQGRKEADLFDLRDFLDLVAVGTVADLAPLTGENRILVKAGLKRIGVSPSAGLKELIRVSRIPECRSSYDIGFKLGPRLNAAGRTGDANRALSLLLAPDAEAAKPFAEQLDAANQMRRSIEDRVRIEAEEKAKSCFNPDTDFGIVVDGKDWPVGVIGIVASRLCREYNRPVVVFSDDGQIYCRGSARSPDGMDLSLIDALDDCGDLLEAYGGHQAAAGLEIDKGKLAGFRDMFNEICRRKLDGKELAPSVQISAWLADADLSMGIIDEIDLLRPFGAGNKGPLWGIKGGIVIGSPRIVGKNHLKLKLRIGRVVIDAIGFGMGDVSLATGESVDAVFELERNHWRGNTTLQMKLKDIRNAL